MSRLFHGTVFMIIVVLILTASACSTSTTISTLAPASDSTTGIGINNLEAPLEIDSLADGKVVHVNLVKFVGSISSPNTKVFINGFSPVINNDGSYYAILELTPGENTIEIKSILEAQTSIEKITVTFIPQLKIWMKIPETDIGIDYSKTPLMVTGFVSNPSAKVEVNGSIVEVASDGSFISKVQLTQYSSSIKANAVLGDEEDSYSLAFSMTDSGLLNIVPGQQLLDYSRASMSPLVEMSAGETVDVNFVLKTGKDIGYIPPEFQLKILRVSKMGDRNPLPQLPNLEFSVSPMEFRLYPDIIYQPIIRLKTDTSLPTGNYYFLFSSYLDNSPWTESWITVKIN